MSRGDLVAAYPSEYLLVRYYGDQATVDNTRSLARGVPWFWGTAVYPPGAVFREPPSPGPVRATSGMCTSQGIPMPDTGGYRIASTGAAGTGLLARRTDAEPPGGGVAGEDGDVRRIS